MRTPKNLLFDNYRTIFWGFCQCILRVLDGLFDIINKIWQYKLFDNSYVNKIFSGAVIVAITWLSLKVLIELVVNYIIRNDKKESPLTIYRGIFITIAMIFLITPLFQFGHKFSSELTNAVIEISELGKSDQKIENSISKMLIEATIFDDKMEEEDKEYLINNWKWVIDINAIDIDLKNGGIVYKYDLNFYLLLVLAVLIVFLLFFIAIQMSKRVMEIALYRILGPFCATSLTNDSRSFNVWFKSCVGAFLITIVQFVSLGLLVNMFLNAFDAGAITGIFLIIGSLLFVISTPTLVSTLLNQQSGVASGFGEMQSLIAIGQGLTIGFNVAKRGATAALTGGTSIAGDTAKMAKGGTTNISNLMNNAKTTNDQSNNFKESLSMNNGYKAQNQINQYLNSNKGITNSTNMNISNMGLRYNMESNRFVNSADEIIKKGDNN